VKEGKNVRLVAGRERNGLNLEHALEVPETNPFAALFPLVLLQSPRNERRRVNRLIVRDIHFFSNLPAQIVPLDADFLFGPTVALHVVPELSLIWPWEGLGRLVCPFPDDEATPLWVAVDHVPERCESGGLEREKSSRPLRS